MTIQNTQVSMTSRGVMEGGINTQLSATEFKDVDTVMASAGLDFHIRRSSVGYKAERGGDWLENRTVKQMLRSDTSAALGGTVSNRFKPLQPMILAGIVQDLHPNGYGLTGAVSINGGEGMVLILKKDGFDLSGDKVDHSLIISTDNTGKAATVAYQSSFRPICLNQLAAAFRNSKNRISVRHTTDWTPAYIDAFVAQIASFSDAADNLAAAADNMASTAMTDRQAVNYFAELYAERDDKNNVTNQTGLERIVNEIMENFKFGPGSDHIAARNTQWGAINAVTHYVDHHTRARSDENRFKSATCGAGYDRKLKAIQLIENLDGTTTEVEVSDPSFEDLLTLPI